MWKFYRQVAWSAVTEFWSATDKTLTATAVALFLVTLLNHKIAERLVKTWDGVSQWWSLVPIGLLVLYRLLRSNYEAFESLEKSKGTEIKDLRAVVERVTRSPNRPQITFARWDQIPATNPVAMPISPTVAGQFLQRGFYLNNDGDAAHEVTVEPFQIENLWCGSGMAPRIEGHGQGFSVVWLETQKGIGSGPPYEEKWNLLGAMSRAEQEKYGSSMYRQQYSVPVSVIYRDSNDVWYRSRSVLTHIRSQHRLDFGPTTHEVLMEKKSA